MGFDPGEDAELLAPAHGPLRPNVFSDANTPVRGCIVSDAASDTAVFYQT